MGAFGNITCDVCGGSYYELDAHECCMDEVNLQIIKRDDRIEELEHGIKWLHTNHNNGQIADLVDAVYHKLIKERD